jgi:hypothetical protein
MPQPIHLFAAMTKRGMANVVEQGRGKKQWPLLGQVALEVFKLV